MGVNREGLHHPRGVYGEDVCSPYGVKIRSASRMESIRLSAQSEFVYYIPFLPMVLSPSLPEAVSEFAYANNLNVDVVHWALDYELVPKLSSSELSTANIFGIAQPHGNDFLNFASGMMLQDEATGLVVRLIIDKVKIIEPTISRAVSMEKLLSNQLEVFVFGLQSPNVAFTLQPDVELKTLRVVKQTHAGDPGLWQVMNKFWSGDKRLIL